MKTYIKSNEVPKALWNGASTYYKFFRLATAEDFDLVGWSEEDQIVDADTEKMLKRKGLYFVGWAVPKDFAVDYIEEKFNNYIFAICAKLNYNVAVVGYFAGRDFIKVNFEDIIAIPNPDSPILPSLKPYIRKATPEDFDAIGASEEDFGDPNEYLEPYPYSFLYWVVPKDEIAEAFEEITGAYILALVVNSKGLQQTVAFIGRKVYDIELSDFKEAENRSKY